MNHIIIAQDLQLIADLIFVKPILNDLLYQGLVIWNSLPAFLQFQTDLLLKHTQN